MENIHNLYSVWSYIKLEMGSSITKAEGRLTKELPQTSRLLPSALCTLLYQNVLLKWDFLTLAITLTRLRAL